MVSNFTSTKTLLLIIIFCIVGLLLFLSVRTDSSKTAGLPTERFNIAGSLNSSVSPVIPKHNHWEDFDEEQLIGLLSLTQERPKNILNTELLVIEGDRVLTSGFQSKNGPFIFSELIPSLNKDGRISFEHKTIRIDLAGNIKYLNSVEYLLDKDGTKEIFYLAEEGETHQLRVEASPEMTSPGAIKMKLTE